MTEREKLIKMLQIEADRIDPPSQHEFNLKGQRLGHPGNTVVLLRKAAAALAAQPSREPDAYAVRNNEGYWCGIWNDRSIAEQVVAKGQPSHGEVIVELYAAPPSGEREGMLLRTLDALAAIEANLGWPGSEHALKLIQDHREAITSAATGEGD